MRSPAFAGGARDLVAPRVVVGQHGREPVAESDPDRAGEGGEVDDGVGLGLAGAGRGRRPG